MIHRAKLGKREPFATGNTYVETQMREISCSMMEQEGSLWTFIRSKMHISVAMSGLQIPQGASAGIHCIPTEIFENTSGRCVHSSWATLFT